MRRQAWQAAPCSGLSSWSLRDAFKRACGLLADMRGIPPEGEGRLAQALYAPEAQK